MLLRLGEMVLQASGSAGVGHLGQGDWHIFLWELDEASFPGQGSESQDFRILFQVWLPTLLHEWMTHGSPGTLCFLSL